MAKDNDIEALYEGVQKESRKLEQACLQYHSNGFQTYVVAKMLKDENSIHVSVLPTGSGKGWIAVLLSRVLSAKG